MPISKDGSGVIQQTFPANKKQFDQYGVIHDSDFALSHPSNVLKQIQFLINPTTSAPGVLTLQCDIAADTTLNVTNLVAGGNSFTTMQPITGTSPTAASNSDTLTFANTDGLLSVLGSAGAKSLTFGIVGNITTTNKFLKSVGNGAASTSTGWATLCQANKNLYVDQDRTDSYTADGTFLYPFKTIGAAITQVVTNADNATYAYTINVAPTPGAYNEVLTLNSALLYNLTFNTQNAIVGNNTLAITSTSSNTNLANLVFNNFNFYGAINLTGNINNTSFGSTQIQFFNCAFQTAGTGFTLNNVNNVSFYGGQIQGSDTHTFTNVAFAYIEGVEGIKPGATLNMVWNGAGNKPVQNTGVNFLLLQNTKVGATITVDAGSSLQATQTYFSSASALTNNGLHNSYGSIYRGTVTLNTGSTTNWHGDKLISQPTLSGSPTVTNTADFYAGGVVLGQRTTPASNPPTGTDFIYCKSDDKLYVKNASGTETLIGPPTAPSLTSAHLFVGNGSNVSTDVAVSGDLTLANTGAFTVATVGGSTAANVHAAELLANAATNANTVSTIVKRDSSGNFSAGTITASLTGAASLNVLLTGGVMTGQLTVKNIGDYANFALRVSPFTGSDTWDFIPRTSNGPLLLANPASGRFWSFSRLGGFASTVSGIEAVAAFEAQGSDANTNPATLNIANIPTTVFYASNAASTVGNYSGFVFGGQNHQTKWSSGMFGVNEVHGSSPTGRIEWHTNQAGTIAEKLRLLSTGQLAIMAVGTGLSIKEGSNAKMGTAVLVGGTVTVSTTAVTASSRIFLSTLVAGGTLGAVSVGTITAGTSFVINSLSAIDTSTIAWVIFEPS